MTNQEKYFCPVCNSVFTDAKTQGLIRKCPDCGIDLVDMGISKEDWEALSPEETQAKMDGLKARKSELLYLDQIHKRLRTISRWVVFFGVMFVIAIIVVSFNTCKAMR